MYIHVHVHVAMYSVLPSGEGQSGCGREGGAGGCGGTGAL